MERPDTTSARLQQALDSVRDQATIFTKDEWYYVLRKHYRFDRGPGYVDAEDLWDPDVDEWGPEAVCLYLVDMLETFGVDPDDREQRPRANRILGRTLPWIGTLADIRQPDPPAHGDDSPLQRVREQSEALRAALDNLNSREQRWIEEGPEGTEASDFEMEIEGDAERTGSSELEAEIYAMHRFGADRALTGVPLLTRLLEALETDVTRAIKSAREDDEHDWKMALGQLYNVHCETWDEHADDDKMTEDKHEAFEYLLNTIGEPCRGCHETYRGWGRDAREEAGRTEGEGESS
jgi:hypothetical protein